MSKMPDYALRFWRLLEEVQAQVELPKELDDVVTAVLWHDGVPPNRWRPIDIAPKDATSVLVWCPALRNVYVVVWDRRNERWRHFAYGDNPLTETPTMWRPVPRPDPGEET